MYKFILPEHIVFEIQPKGIKIFNLISMQYEFIGFPQAALWDMLSRQFEWNEIVSIYKVLLPENQDSTFDEINLFVEMCLKKGLLIKVPQNNG